MQEMKKLINANKSKECKGENNKRKKKIIYIHTHIQDAKLEIVELPLICRL